MQSCGCNFSLCVGCARHQCAFPRQKLEVIPGSRLHSRLDGNCLILVPAIVGPAYDQGVVQIAQTRKVTVISVDANLFVGRTHHKTCVTGFSQKLKVRLYRVVVPERGTIHQLGSSIVGDVEHGAVDNLPCASEGLPCPLARLSIPIPFERVLEPRFTVCPAKPGEPGGDAGEQQRGKGNRCPQGPSCDALPPQCSRLIG
jgi:hypothetical protein